MCRKLSLMLLLVPVCSFLVVCDRDRPVEPPAEFSAPLGPGLYLGPVEGLTTGWHPVPENLALPRGQAASFRFVGPDGMVVAWVGAREVEASDGVSTATCSIDRPGPMEVRVDAVFPGGRAHTRVCRFDVLDVRVDDITVREVSLSARQPDFDSHSKGGKDPGAQGTSVNELTMSFFFGDESIAALTETKPGHFVTSVRRSVRMSIDVDPPAFAPLMEWRVNRRAYVLGETATKYLTDRGACEVSVGPLRQEYIATIETYDVAITSHRTGTDRIAEGYPVTFAARTTPLGYEAYVTWLASTKYGDSDPIMGTGPTFTVTFNKTWGPEPEAGGGLQWLGVRADNAIFDQDQKSCDSQCPPCDPFDFEGSCMEVTPGMPIGEGSISSCLCIRTPIGPGKVEWIDCGQGFLTDHCRVLLENQLGALAMPAAGQIQGIEAIYFKNITIGGVFVGRAVLKVPDHCTATVTCINNAFSISCCCNIAASAFWGFCREVTPGVGCEDMWPTNDF